MSGRRFSERQTAQILRKAAELQARAGHGTTAPGATEDELRAAAREIGLDPRFLDQALAEIDRDAGLPAGFWGGPLAQEVETTFDGEVDDELWEDTVAELRRIHGEEGTISTRGSTREWTGTGGGVASVQFTVRQSGGQVRVSSTARLDGLASVTFILGALPVLIGFATLGKGVKLPLPVEIAIGAVWFVLVFLGCRVLVTKGARAVEAKLHQSVARLRERAETNGSRQGLAQVTQIVAEAEVHATEPAN